MRSMLTVLTLLAVAMLLLVMVLPLTAQESTHELRATVVDGAGQPVLVVSADDGFPGPFTVEQALAIIAAIYLVVNGFIQMLREKNYERLLDGYKQALARKDLQDEAERQYMRSSIPIKDAIQLMRSGLTVAGNLNFPIADGAIDASKDFLDRVTDGKPNE